MDLRPPQVKPLLIAGGGLWLLFLLGTLVALPNIDAPGPGVQAGYALLLLARDAGQLLVAGGLLLQVLAWYGAWRAGPPSPDPGVDDYR